MKQILIRNVARPLVERLGTAMAVWLVASGWQTDLVQQFATAVASVVLVGVDLLMSKHNSQEAR